MDGTYAPTSSWPYSGAGREAFEAIRREDDGLPYWQDFDFEIDLLLEKPEEHIEEWVLAGAVCVVVHVESTKKLDEIVRECQERRLEYALAIKPSTDTSMLESHIAQAVFVQCMGNDRIGYHGVSLDDRALAQVRAVRKNWPTTPIGVDIGVSEETIPALVAAGATRFAAGSAVYGRGTPVDTYRALELLVESELHKKEVTK